MNLVEASLGYSNETVSKVKPLVREFKSTTLELWDFLSSRVEDVNNYIIQASSEELSKDLESLEDERSKLLWGRG